MSKKLSDKELIAWAWFSFTWICHDPKDLPDRLTSKQRLDLELALSKWRLLFGEV